MGLTWIVVVIAGCLALAGCIAAVLLRPMAARRRRLRPLANVDRLTQLPEYVRARRRRTAITVGTIALLTATFAAAVVTAARPTGLPSATGESGTRAPEDVMVCVGGPPTDPATGAALRYFADRVTEFDTQRIGLTSSNRRVIPMTRDYQYASAQFSAAAEDGGRGDDFASPVSYVDYSESVEDLLALCLTGFPSFEQKADQRRSLIYVGPGTLRTPNDRGTTLFTADRVRDIAIEAGVQVNVLFTGPAPDALVALAADTGGQSFPAESSVIAHLDEIRDRPPAPAAPADEAAVTTPADTPDVPLLLALAAIAALAVWPAVARR